MTKDLLESLPYFEVSLSSQESVESARKALVEYNSHAFLVKAGKDVVGYVTSGTLACAHPSRLLMDVPMEDVMYFPSLSCTELYHLMGERNIPIVGIKKDEYPIFFLERKGVYNYLMQRTLVYFNLVEKHYPLLMAAFMDETQRLISELEFIKEVNLSEAGLKHQKAAFRATANVVTSAIFILDLHRMGLMPKKMEEMDLMSAIKEISQRLASLYPEIIIEVDDSTRGRAPAVWGDIFLSDMLLAVILMFVANEAFPGKLRIGMSHSIEEGFHIIKFDGTQPTAISGIETSTSNGKTPKNHQQDTPFSLFLEKELERYHGGITVTENTEGGQTILLRLPVNDTVK